MKFKTFISREDRERNTCKLFSILDYGDMQICGPDRERLVSTSLSKELSEEDRKALELELLDIQFRKAHLIVMEAV